MNGVTSGRESSDRWGAWLLDAVSGVRFRAISGGVYAVGLSEAELSAGRAIDDEPQWSVDELTPVVSAGIGDLWVAELPVSCCVARAAGVSVSGEDDEPALVTFDEVETICAEFGWRALGEAEWEICCRAGGSTLFAWGDALPSGEELGAWLSWDMAGDEAPRNGWGLGSLFFGEWCDEPFRTSRSPDAPVVGGARVIKGGGAQFWPWQTGREWVWCVSAMRMPSTALFAEGRAAFRPCRTRA